MFFTPPIYEELQPLPHYSRSTCTAGVQLVGQVPGHTLLPLQYCRRSHAAGLRQIYSRRYLIPAATRHQPFSEFAGPYHMGTANFPV